MNFIIQNSFFDHKDYTFLHTILGNASSSTVYLVERKKDQKKFALKTFNKINQDDANDQMRIMNAIAILQKVHHLAIINFYGLNFISYCDPKQFQPSILLDFYGNGSLYDMINRECHGLADFEWSQTKKCINIIGIAHAIKYLHKNGIIHRDIKTENVILDYDLYPKLIDFDWSVAFPHPLTNDMEFDFQYKVGTPIYMAPELLKDNEKYGPAIDVYAYSFCIYEILNGIPLYLDKFAVHYNELTEKILNGERPILDNHIFTEKMQDLISQCWNEDPLARPSFDEIYEKLSTDYKSYFNYDIDECEIECYIDDLNSI